MCASANREQHGRNMSCPFTSVEPMQLNRISICDQPSRLEQAHQLLPRVHSAPAHVGSASGLPAALSQLRSGWRAGAQQAAQRQQRRADAALAQPADSGCIAATTAAQTAVALLPLQLL